MKLVDNDQSNISSIDKTKEVKEKLLQCLKEVEEYGFTNIAVVMCNSRIESVGWRGFSSDQFKLMGLCDALKLDIHNYWNLEMGEMIDE